MSTPNPYFTYLVELLKNMLEKGASDLFVTVGSPPAIKIKNVKTGSDTMAGIVSDPVLF
jgi:Tfp pilus assembly ATPase PilU